MYLTLGEIADAVGGRIADSTDKSVRISGVFTDSREAHIKRNRLFVAIKGSKTDAHIFVKEITSQGNFALVEDENYFTENTILVDSTTDSLQELAAWYRRDRLSGTKIIAVTGSVGKTSTKDMVAL
ncbi:MAG: UDP-N-acetylmuramoyl-tripeptide--D-alanyl-D-alanine ligase, partial [Firmicutes bacterium HGW-Firmicutes-21]